jgi:uncharacterized protein with HEPN domain
MREPDDETSVQHIADAARKIVRFTSGLTRKDLDTV